MNLDMEMNMEILSFGCQISVGGLNPISRHNVGLCHLQSDFPGSDIRLSLITDIKLNAHQWSEGGQRKREAVGPRTVRPNMEHLWRACNLTSFSPCLTDPVDYLFASRHKGPRFKSPGGTYVKPGFSC